MIINAIALKYRPIDSELLIDESVIALNDNRFHDEGFNFKPSATFFPWFKTKHFSTRHPSQSVLERRDKVSLSIEQTNIK